ncbi:hypothetical protein FCOIX_13033 [Fusarium coicis]|nr:hypothetical protein FCOIX_13033 [Fusarium coicis]
MMLSKLSPPLSVKHVQMVNDGWQQEQRVHFYQLVARTFLRQAINREVDMALQFGGGPAVFEPFDAYRDEMGALECELLDKSSKYHEAVLKASQRIGISKTTADMNADSLMRTTFVRHAVNAAGINMAATALFDIKTLFDGGFQNYFLKLGISGAYGGTVSVCSSKIDHPIFGYGAVVGVVVGSAFNMASLASTGNWSRFGKNTGFSIGGLAAGGGKGHNLERWPAPLLAVRSAVWVGALQDDGAQANGQLLGNSPMLRSRSHTRRSWKIAQRLALSGLFLVETGRCGRDAGSEH